MNEKFPSINQPELNTEDQEIRIEYEGYIGAARLIDGDQNSANWEIVIAAGDRIIAYWYSTGDVENARNEINNAIDSFLWDPMSQA